MVYGVVMVSTWSYKENTEGMMRATEQISLGQAVDFYSITDNGKTVPEKKTAKIVNYQGVSDGKDYVFWRYAARDGDSYLLQWTVADDAIPAAVTAEGAVLYTKPALDAVDTKGRTIPQYSIIALHPDEGENGFVCVSASIPNVVTADRMFVKGEYVTDESNDVQALQLYTKALATENETVKRELLNNANDLGGTFSRLTFDALWALDNPGRNFDNDDLRGDDEEEAADGSVG
jgi:hypothetical protein